MKILALLLAVSAAGAYQITSSSVPICALDEAAATSCDSTSAPCCAAPSRAAQVAAAPPAGATLELGCKPLAPFDVVFAIEREGGGTSELHLAVAPRRAMREVTWSLDFVGEAHVVEGNVRGRAGLTTAQASQKDGLAASAFEALAAGETVADERVTLVTPAPSRFTTAVLNVAGVFEGTDENGDAFAETLRTSRTIQWSRPASPVPLRTTVDVATGLVESVAVVPSTHIPAAGGDR